MKNLGWLPFFCLLNSFVPYGENLPVPTATSLTTADSIPPKNQQVLDYVAKNGPMISSTYEKAVCTELVISVLKNFIQLNSTEKQRIRIISTENIESLRRRKSPVITGVKYALVSSSKGKAIEAVADVKPGDFVQFWYSDWGHCGIVKSIDLQKKEMELYSSFPSTNGFGILNFPIPDECFFVRLK